MKPGVFAPVRRERLPFHIEPEQIFEELFAHETHAFWLDAGVSEKGTSYLGTASPTRPGVQVLDGALRLVTPDGTTDASDDLVDLVRSGLARPGLAHSDEVPEGIPLGWVGWFGYEFGARAVGAPTARSPFPDVALIPADSVVEYDHESGALSLWFFDDETGRAWAAAAGARLAEISRRGARQDESQAAPVAASDRPGTPQWRHSDTEYLHLIERCQQAITEGDAYQLCLTNAVSLSTREAPFDVYRRLRRESPAPYGGYLRFGDVALLSSSPELFLSVRDGVAITSPVKGTARRVPQADDDARARDALAHDEKERAENLMIVDLMRNDLSRVARLGGVQVSALLEVETHRHVHQLVSTVEARLTDGVDALDVLAACFPAGSMTGVPKLSAMGILHELECGPRGVYSGCFGRLALDGSAEFAMVIRSIVMTGGRAVIGTGGGITALSVPERELAEIKLKAAALLAALRVHDGL